MSQIRSIGTRESIVEAATALFSEHGYRGASVREVCSRAGVSANAITYHFGSKERLYRDILDSFASLQLEHAKTVLSADPRSQQEFVVRIEFFFEKLLDVYIENRETLLVMSREFDTAALWTRSGT